MIVLKSYNENDDIKGVYALGVNSFARKSIGYEDFLTVIDKLCKYWLIINQTIK